MTIRQIPEIDDNPRVVPLDVPGFDVVTVRHDSVEPVPVGTYVLLAFRVEGYDKDCDGSLLVRLARVDRNGQETGWEPDGIMLDSVTALIVDDPVELWSHAVG